ncbi:MAG: hypothetical protein JXA49_07470 [Actinobacteria bacterium]|nr:hypothetical protein [Actinomycetota bacterium]
MRRAVVIVAVLLLALSSMAIVGCGGGDTETAKKYMKTADAAAEDLQKKSEDILNKAMAILMPALSGDLSGANSQDLPMLSEEMGQLNTEADAVKADYEKITKLEGVPDYVEYADAMIKWVDIYKETLAEGEKMFSELTPIYDEAIKTGDATALMSALTSISGGQEDIQKGLEDQQKKAEKIKKDKNLAGE